MEGQRFFHTEFNISMPRNDIANVFGVTVESINRELTLLQKEGVINTERRQIKINSFHSLKIIAE